MAYVLADGRTVVTAAPGTGSTALVEALARTPGVRHLGVPEGRGPGGPDPKHATFAELRAAGDLGFSPVTVVTTTRNPFSYWFSEWRRSRLRWAEELPDPDSWVHRTGLAERIEAATRLGLDDWLELVLGADARAGRTRHLNPGHIAEADVVMRTETLAADVRRHLPGVAPLRASNVTGSPARLDEVYGERGRRLVAAVHRPDLDRFGYRFTTDATAT